MPAAFSQELRNEILKRLNKGETCQAIADKCGVGIATVKRLKKNAPAMAPDTMAAQIFDRAVDRVAGNLTARVEAAMPENFAQIFAAGLQEGLQAGILWIKDAFTRFVDEGDMVKIAAFRELRQTALGTGTIKVMPDAKKPAPTGFSIKIVDAAVKPTAKEDETLRIPTNAASSKSEAV
jgi:hypothetical protein